MKKMFMILIAFTIMAGLISCATTSSINTSGIKESKLTNISYLKKICDVKLAYSKKGVEVYLLDNGKGYLVHTVDDGKACLIVKDGELYGRSEFYLSHNLTVAFNLHDNKCTQICTSDSYFTDEALDKMTESNKDFMIKLSKEFGLEKYINNIE